MKKTLLVGLLFVSFTAFAQQTVSWYKLITGMIDKYPVTMHLHKAGHNYYGYYYYDAQQKPIYFNGDDTSVKEKINLVAFSTSDATESFSFSLSDVSLKGVWKKEEGSKALLFSGTEMQPVIPLTYVFTEGEKKLRPKMSESPQATFFSGCVWPVGNSEPAMFLQRAVTKAYGQKSAGMEIGKLMLRDKNEFFKAYESDFKDVKPADFKESPFMYNMDKSENTLIVYQSPKMATLANFTYVYSGGAHGNYSTVYTSYDLLNKKELKLNDVLTLQGKNKLSSLLAKSLRSQFKLKPTDALTEVLFENKIAPNDNFYITGKGIGFSYSPYEIAAYAYGEINLFIPFKDIEANLQPGFKKLLQ